MLRKYRYIGLVLFFMLWITACSDSSNEGNKQVSQQKESLQFNSQLKNMEECYLCGNSDKSMMSYYRQFDSVGLIALNEWYILECRINTEETNSSSSTVCGKGESFTYQVNAMPNRGKATMVIASEEKLNEELLQKCVCPNCFKQIEKIVLQEIPFVLVDFKTLKLYPLANENINYFIRDYWVEIETEKDVEIEIYYLPRKE